LAKRSTVTFLSSAHLLGMSFPPLSALAALLMRAALVPVSAAANPSASPVVVELFTSEGCSSCPPADALLARLDESGTGQGPEVLILGEHVDYWNHLGWKDRFSSAELSRRQSQYAQRFRLDSVYTPQMVIDGRYELVGNEESAVRQKIAAAAQKSKETSIVLSWHADKLTVEAHGSGNRAAEVLLAVTENGLSSAVAHGENGGRTLRHSGVVRELRRIGSLNHGQFSTTVTVKPQTDWKPEQLRIVVFAQDAANGEVIGAAALDFQPVTAAIRR
jgi:hypothetical protein